MMGQCVCGERYDLINAQKITDIAYVDKDEYVMKDYDSLFTQEKYYQMYLTGCKKCKYLCDECIKKSQDDGCLFTFPVKAHYEDALEVFYADNCINCTLPPK